LKFYYSSNSGVSTRPFGKRAFIAWTERNKTDKLSITQTTNLQNQKLRENWWKSLTGNLTGPENKKNKIDKVTKIAKF
jgi:hypothetical protein